MKPSAAAQSTDNTTGRSTPALAIHRPQSRADVVDLVHSARARRVPLYPYSTGLNWGYGSRSPVLAGCELVDLSAMRRIRNRPLISSAHPVALIEPGVTQGDLDDFLREHHPGLTFNVTGSARDTSIIGNALDRGVGYLGPRKDDLYALEIVTGSGEFLKTGFRRLGEDSPLAQDHPFGLGPMLDGLFFQSNFGIVTSACFRLVPRRPVELTLSLAIRPGVALGAFLDVLSALKREGLLPTVTHVAHRARSRSTLSPGIVDYLRRHCGMPEDAARMEAGRILDQQLAAEWNSLGSIAGNRWQVAAMVLEIRRRVARVATLKVFTERTLGRAFALAHRFRWSASGRRSAALLAAAQPLQAMPAGRPSDNAVYALLATESTGPRPAVQLDQSELGLLYISPALPSDGMFVQALLARLQDIARQHGHELFITINLETASSMVAVINLLFKRHDSDDVERAHRCGAALLAHLHGAKLEVYRARADMMRDITARDPDYWQLVGRIKRVFDPDGVIAPGRYGAPG